MVVLFVFDGECSKMEVKLENGTCEKWDANRLSKLS